MLVSLITKMLLPTTFQVISTISSDAHLIQDTIPEKVFNPFSFWLCVCMCACFPPALTLLCRHQLHFLCCRFSTVWLSYHPFSLAWELHFRFLGDLQLQLFHSLYCLLFQHWDLEGYWRTREVNRMARVGLLVELQTKQSHKYGLFIHMLGSVKH